MQTRAGARDTVYTVLRSAQVNFPGLVDAKFATTRRLRAIRRRPFEPDFNALRHFPADAATYLDVGANRGQSCEAIRLCRPDARITMFEPNRVLASRLVERFGGQAGIEVLPFGLGETASEADLFIPFYKGWMFDGLASFDRAAAEEWLPPRIYRYDPDRLRIEESRCEIRTLDSLGLDPFFMKIDVQGFERSVLAGGRSTLERCEPILLIEAAGPSEVQEYLAALGYTPFRWDGSHLVAEGYGRLNTFFLTEGKQELLRSGVPDLLR